MKKLMFVVMTAVMSAAMTGCANPRASARSGLDDALYTTNLSPEDVRETVEKMVDSMLTDRAFLQEYVQNRPILDIGPMENRTTRHIDLKSITSSIRTKLIRSHMFKFMDHSTAAVDAERINDQAFNALTDQSKAIQSGQQSAAQLYLFGELTEARQHVRGVNDSYYKFTLNMKDLRTGEIAWSDEKEVRKQTARSVF